MVSRLDHPQLPPSRLIFFALPLPLQPRRLTPALLCFSEPLSGPPISPLLKGSDVNASPSKGESGSELLPLLRSSWGPSDWPGNRWFPLPGTTSTLLKHLSSSPPHPEPPDLKSPPYPLSPHHKVLFLLHVIFPSSIYDRLSFYIWTVQRCGLRSILGITVFSAIAR